MTTPVHPEIQAAWDGWQKAREDWRTTDERFQMFADGYMSPTVAADGHPLVETNPESTEGHRWTA